MDVKDMREKLADVVEVVPRSNEDVEALFLEKFPEAKDTYTYIGQGDTPPNIIKFMGIQVFSRGKATQVSDPRVLKKISNNPCFIKGEVSSEELYENDEVARKRVDKQREEDVKVQIEVDRQNKE